MDLQKNSIDLFLQSVCRFVWDDEKAKDIQDELKDHISSYVEEYMDDLNGSISSKFIDVQEDVEREVNGALENFGKQLKKAIDEKLTQLKQYV